MLVYDEKIKIDFHIIDSEGNLVFEKIGNKDIIFRFFAYLDGNYQFMFKNKLKSFIFFY